MKPASTFIPSRAAIVDKNGMATYPFIKILQDWDTKLQNGLSPSGEITAPIPADTQIQGRTEGIGITVQHLDDTGQVLAGGIDFARAYINKDTDHIADGTGSPLAGGVVAFAALVASSPAIGQTIRFNGSHWLPVAIAVQKNPVGSQWLNSYDAVTGAFTASQPAFTNISGAATAAQVPALSALSGRITTGQLPTGLFSGTVALAKLTVSGTDGSLTLVNGSVSAYTPPT